MSEGLLRRRASSVPQQLFPGRQCSDGHSANPLQRLAPQSVQHGGAQGREPGEHLVLVTDDALLGGGRRGEHCAERAELAYEAVGPAGGAGSDRPEEFVQDLSAP